MRSGRGVTELSSGRARGRSAARADNAVGDDPFALLGLPARPGLSDDDVRAAWRRIAAATHPDREDGGDPARFGAAAAAYVVLRTGFGRGEALADLGLGEATDHRARHARRRRPSDPAPSDPAASGAGRHRARRRAPVGRPTGARLPGLTPLRGWRPGGLAVRVAAACAVCVVAVAISGWSPGLVGVLAGVLTWLVATARQALRRRRSR